ncbi:hypothetical protein F4810DRAFT_682198 [Camillea tinctor]|nr:hypothetical protein F4810DRAFT_682198 [Camillea tinctor]
MPPPFPYTTPLFPISLICGNLTQPYVHMYVVMPKEQHVCMLMLLCFLFFVLTCPPSPLPSTPLSSCRPAILFSHTLST